MNETEEAKAVETLKRLMKLLKKFDTIDLDDPEEIICDLSCDFQEYLIAIDVAIERLEFIE